MQPTISWESGLWKNKLYHFASEYCIIHIYFPLLLHICLDSNSGHATHFQVGGDNPKVERGSWKNQYGKQSCILCSLWYFHFGKQRSRGKIQLDEQFAQCPAAVECPEVDTIFIFLY